MSSTVKCLSCGAIFDKAIGPCIHCGGEIGQTISLSGVEGKAFAGQIGTVVDSSVSGGGQKIAYTAPSGARSNTTRIDDKISVMIEPPIDVGTRGESRVLACVIAALASNGIAPISLKASDRDGEDGVLQIAGEDVVLQIVTVGPPKGTFWSDVAKGKSEVHASISEATGWIDNAIQCKARLYKSKDNKFMDSMLLALDLAHMGVLATNSLCEQYLQNFGDPSVRYQFGGVWLIGPTQSHCLRLGASRW